MGRILPTLPPDITQGATLQGNEYGWIISLFPDAVVAAKKYNYACLGGQFQFRLPDGGTCEMYWLSADSTNRANEEPWQDFSCRSCDEVLERFHALVSKTDFRERRRTGREYQMSLLKDSITTHCLFLWPTLSVSLNSLI